MKSLRSCMLFSDVCKPLGAVLTCNHLAIELEMLKTASTSNVHCNTHTTQLLCAQVWQKPVNSRARQANLVLLWQACCFWKQKLCWFTKREESSSSPQTLQGWCSPEKLREVAGKFCDKWKGYIKQECSRPDEEHSFNIKYFWRKE